MAKGIPMYTHSMPTSQIEKRAGIKTQKNIRDRRCTQVPQNNVQYVEKNDGK